MRGVSAEPGITVRSPVTGLGVLCGALALVMGAMTSLNVALPDIGRATGASQSELTWIIDAYTVVFAGLLLPCGALGDRYGRRRMLIVGLLVFALACALGPIGDDPAVLTATRGLAGLGAALVMPATLSLITTTMRAETQARAVGLWVATATLGGALGIVFAGVVLEYADWRAILFVSAVAALLVAGAGTLVEESSDPDPPRFDYAGALTSTAAIGLVVLGILEAPTHGWSSPFVWSAVVAGLLSGLVFARLQLRKPNPLLDIRIFRSRLVLVGSLGLVAMFAVLFGYFYLVVQFLQLIEGRSPLNSGLMLLPAAATIVPFTMVANPLVERFGLRVVMTFGLMPMVEAFALMARVHDGDNIRFVIAMLLFGASIGLCVTPATVAILRSVPTAKQGVASAVNDAVREVGAALGIAVVGSVLATGYGRNLGPAVDALPESAQEPMRASFAGALQVRQAIGPSADAAVAQARNAFLSGLHGAFLACSIFIAAVAVTVAVFAPDGGEAPATESPRGA